jgi:predicted patatin/cPLA2 family phospholipase
MSREKTALIVEGGAMRGVFSVGVLDVFLEHAFHPFDLALGVSAGACNLASHLGGQRGRNYRAYFDLMTRRDFIDPLRALRGGSIVDLDWLWDELALRDPLNVSGVVGGSTEFVVVATSAASGAPVYLRPAEHDMFDVLKGSCALPMLYRPTIVVRDEPLVDGGVADPIPVEEAYRRGARRIVVVRSRPAAFFKKPGFESRAMPFLFRNRAALVRAMQTSPATYRRSVEFMLAPPADCTIVQIAPPEPLATKRTSRDKDALGRDYALGRSLGLDAMNRWNDN